MADAHPVDSIRLVRRNLLAACGVIALLCIAARLNAQHPPRVAGPPGAIRRTSLEPDAPLPMPEEVLALPLRPEPGTALPTTYSTAWDRWPPPAPTCTSCAASTGQHGCSLAEGYVSQFWHCDLKPWLQESHWGYCNYFDEKPFGSSLRQAMGIQVAQAAAGQLVLYQYDFLDLESRRPAELNERGREQLVWIAQRLAYAPLPVTVEHTPGHPHVDLARRAHVVHLLQHQGVPVTERSVIIRPVRHGLLKDEAV
jgi:hypothetical protein